ncbi:MAG: branched-chain amino acid ABC transporter substrate-binding protein [Gammaproteobacteria bacterium]|nr:branched-chain amino acid ABC transporter substrate-binding protein [Gammaproteobacteria bacterium]
MNKKLFVLLSLLVIASFVLAACAPAATEAPPAEEAPVEEAPTEAAPAEEEAPGDYECTDPLGCVLIGPDEPVHVAYALVLSTADETLGIDSRNGLEIAVDDKAQILGHDIQLTGEDDQCSAEGGQSAAAKLSADPSIVAVVGTSCSSAARVGVPLLSQAGLLIVSPSNTGVDLTLEGENWHPGYGRTAHADSAQGPPAAQFAYEVVGARKAATIHDGSLYADQLQAEFAKAFEALGGEIVAREVVDPEQTDFKSVLTSIAPSEPDIIYYPIFIKAGALITRQAQETAGLENTTLMGADGMYSPDVMEGAGDAVEGLFVSSPDLAAFGDQYRDDFLPKYQEKFGVEIPLSIFHAHAYDAFMLIAEAIESAAVQLEDGSLVVPRQALRDAFYAIENHQGLTGNLTCSEHGDCADPVIAVYEYHVGEFPPERVWP